MALLSPGASRDPHKTLSLAHFVLIGTFIGFGLSSVTLGVILTLKDGSPTIEPIRVRREAKGEARSSHIEIKSRFDVDELWSSESFLSVPQDDVFVFILTDEKVYHAYSKIIRMSWGDRLPFHQFLFGMLKSEIPDHRRVRQQNGISGK